MELIVSHKFFKLFQQYAENTSNEVLVMRFEKNYSGNEETYGTIIELLDNICQSFKWIVPSFIALPYSPKILNDCNRSFSIENGSYENWRNYILNKYAVVPLLNEDPLGEIVEFHFRYKLNELKKFERLYNAGTISLNFNGTKTIGEIQLEFRREFFTFQPWGEKYPDFTLSLEEVAANRETLKHALQLMENKGYSCEIKGIHI